MKLHEIPLSEVKRILSTTTKTKTVETLKQGNCYCAAGVVFQAVIDGDILIDSKKNPDNWSFNAEDFILIDGEPASFYDLQAALPLLREITKLNDNGNLTFKEIAEKL